MDESIVVTGLNELVRGCHQASIDGGWWHDLNTGEKLKRDPGMLIALLHSELSEMLEAIRKDLMDDKLTHRKGVEVEAADVLIRLCDFCGANDLDLAGALVEKMNFNRVREDHKPENRRLANGKAF